MEKNPLISIIIPVFNRASTIKECIKAILNQTYKNFELVLIDDGSKDETLTNIKSINDDRVKWFHQDNAGVSAARNKGIEIVKGEWICFIDSDDVIQPEYLSEFINNGLNISSADLYIQNIRVIRNSKYIDSDQEKWLLYYLQPFGKLVNFTEYIEKIDITRVAHPFPKIFRSDIIFNYNLKFNTKYHNAEDCLFEVQYLSIAPKIFCIDTKQYYYQKNDEDSQSLSGAQSKGRIDGKELINVFKEIFLTTWSVMESNKAKVELIRYIQSRLTDAIIYSFNFGYLGNTKSEKINYLKVLSEDPSLKMLFERIYFVDHKSKKNSIIEYLIFRKQFKLLNLLSRVW